jgi:hypothetical protein
MRHTNSASRIAGVVKTAEVIYLHTLVAQNASGKFAVPVSNATSQRIVGIAIEGRDMAANGTYTGDGTVVCECIYNVSIQMPLKTIVTVALSGAAVYATDNFTVGRSTTNGPQAGILEEFTSANLGWVRIRFGAMAKDAG